MKRFLGNVLRRVFRRDATLTSRPPPDAVPSAPAAAAPPPPPQPRPTAATPARETAPPRPPEERSRPRRAAPAQEGARPELRPPRPVPAPTRPAPPPPPSEPTDFDRLLLDPRILQAVHLDLGFRSCTPIQQLVLPPALAGRDVTGRAQTGTGKTAAFLITVLQRLLNVGGNPGAKPFALVLAPTRELAIQIDHDAASLAAHTGLRHLVVHGGMDYAEQRGGLHRGVDLLTATPGRLLDFMRQGAVDLGAVQILIIDEADRMLDMGFIPDVRRILARVPPTEKRQTLLFSATLGPPILRLAARWMHDPVTVEAAPEMVVPDEVEQIVYAVPSHEKLALLLWLLRQPDATRVLVFRNRRDQSERLALELEARGVDCALLSGDVPQKRRLRVLELFRAGQLRLIVATDVAGRGIHVDSISHVVNYDLPYEPEDYVHRIGRTGRAGVRGKAISFACEEGAFILPDIEAFIHRSLPTVAADADMLKLDHPTRPPHDRPDPGGFRSRSRPGLRSRSGPPRRRR